MPQKNILAVPLSLLLLSGGAAADVVFLAKGRRLESLYSMCKLLILFALYKRFILTNDEEEEYEFSVGRLIKSYLHLNYVCVMHRLTAQATPA